MTVLTGIMLFIQEITLTVMDFPIGPNVLTSVYPHFIDNLFVPMFLFTCEDAGSSVHNFFSLLLGDNNICLWKKAGKSIGGNYLSRVLWGNPRGKPLCTFSFNDLGSAWYLLMSLYMLYFMLPKNKVNYIFVLLSGLFAGWTLQSRLNAGFYILSLTGITMIFLLFQKKSTTEEIKQRLTRLCSWYFLWGIMFLLGMVPWLIRNYWQTGNPFTPYGLSIFHISPYTEYAVTGFSVISNS